MKTKMKDKKQLLFEIADSQGGHFTAKQARKVGYYNRLQHYHKKNGDWVLLERGIYRLKNYPVSDRDDMIRWSLWSFNRRGEPQGIFSHQTALALHDLGDFMPSKIHITVPPRFVKKIPSKIVVLHRGVLPPEDVENRSSFKVTTPLRSLYDAFEAHVEPNHLERAVNDALTRGIVRLDQVHRKGSTDEMERFLAYVRMLRNQIVHKGASRA